MVGGTVADAARADKSGTFVGSARFKSGEWTLLCDG
jgi:hypothetical protein